MEVGADDEVGHVRHRAVSDDMNRFQRLDRAEETRLRAEMFGDFGLVGHPVIGEPRQFRQLDFIDRMIAAHQGQREAMFGNQGKTFDCFDERDAQQDRQRGDDPPGQVMQH